LRPTGADLVKWVLATNRRPSEGVEPGMDIQLIAVQVGDALKCSTTVNEVDRIGAATLRVRKERFTNAAITAKQAQGVYGWVLSLGKGGLSRDETEARLIKFCKQISRDEDWPVITKILTSCGISAGKLNREDFNLFMGRGFHPVVITHSRALFL